jgi:hypothetical protein
LDATSHEDFTQFRAAIEGCLDNLSTGHKSKMETLLTHKFQMFEDVPLFSRIEYIRRAGLWDSD